MLFSSTKYVWYIETTDFGRIPFYYTHENINPLESDEELFSSVDCWSLDCAYETNGFYPEDPEDNSFVLIPKKDVIRVWSELKRMECRCSSEVERISHKD